MRIGVCPIDFDGPGSYRVLFPMRELHRRGHEVRIPAFKAAEKNGFQTIRYTADVDKWCELPVDVFVFQFRYEDFLADVARAMQDRGIRVVVEIDDLVHRAPHGNPMFGFPRGKLRALEDLIRQADGVTCATSFLTDFYGRFNANVHVLPNFLDWPMWQDAPQQSERHRRRIRVGWMGSSKWRNDLVALQGIVGPFLRRHPEIEFVAAGDPKAHDILDVPPAQRVTTASVPFRNHDLADITAVMDIGLVPLERNDFNEGKSCLKGMEYAACGIPCIATPTAEYRAWVDGTNGLLAEKTKDWVNALELLVGDDLLRRRMGRAARAKAETVTIQEHAGLWEDFYAGICADSHDRGERQAA